MIRTIVLPVLAFSILGCNKSGENSAAVFGGEGAKIEGPDSHPLTEEDERPKMSGPCEKAPPPGQDAILDDFEDGDHQLFKTYHREGWWFVADDGTEGAEFTPKKGEFAPEKLLEGEGTTENEMALHGTASGMNDWGIVWGTTLRWKKDAVSCPFNGSHFDGIRFRTKGTGTIKIKINTIETSPPDNGGVCQKECWDAHGKVVRLTDEWRDVFIRWEDLQQEGWGTDSRFDATRLLALNFTAKPEMLPADFWVDDIRFIEKGEKAPEPPAAPSETASNTSPKEESNAPPSATPSTESKTNSTSTSPAAPPEKKE